MLTAGLRAWRRWRDGRYLAGNRIDEARWQPTRGLPALAHLTADEHDRLRDLASLLLRDKQFFGTHNFVPSDWMCVRIAAEGALPLLELPPGDHYADFSSIVLYESTFVADRAVTDDAGVVHEYDQELLGESWERGPLILSWADIENPPDPTTNVVLHEFAHKLDGGDGVLDGRPVLRKGMRGAAWHDAFAAAYDDLCGRVARAEARHAEVDSAIDPYAEESPEEFFAVCVESFFMQPGALLGQYPQVYAQLAQWLGQDPHARQPRAEVLPPTELPPTEPPPLESRAPIRGSPHHGARRPPVRHGR